MLVFSLVTLLGEILSTHPTDDSRRAIDIIVGPPMGAWFWGAGIVGGHLLPLALLSLGTGWAPPLAALLLLAGLLVIERCWILAPQWIPLS